jgi:hypothetical protein
MTDRASLVLNVRWMQLGETFYDDDKSPGFGTTRGFAFTAGHAHSSEPPSSPLSTPLEKMHLTLPDHHTEHHVQFTKPNYVAGLVDDVLPDFDD